MDGRGYGPGKINGCIPTPDDYLDPFRRRRFPGGHGADIPFPVFGVPLNNGERKYQESEPNTDYPRITRFVNGLSTILESPDSDQSDGGSGSGEGVHVASHISGQTPQVGNPWEDKVKAKGKKPKPKSAQAPVAAQAQVAETNERGTECDGFFRFKPTKTVTGNVKGLEPGKQL